MICPDPSWARHPTTKGTTLNPPPSRYDYKEQFVGNLNQMATDLHATSVEHGFYDNVKVTHETCGTKILLTVTELSELYEGLRRHPVTESMPDKDCPEFSNEVIEAADAVIRILDYCSWRQLPIGAAIVAKAKFNEGRPYKHGKQV